MLVVVVLTALTIRVNQSMCHGEKPALRLVDEWKKPYLAVIDRRYYRPCLQGFAAGSTQRYQCVVHTNGGCGEQSQYYVFNRVCLVGVEDMS